MPEYTLKVRRYQPESGEGIEVTERDLEGLIARQLMDPSAGGSIGEYGEAIKNTCEVRVEEGLERIAEIHLHHLLSIGSMTPTGTICSLRGTYVYCRGS